MNWERISHNLPWHLVEHSLIRATNYALRTRYRGVSFDKIKVIDVLNVWRTRIAFPRLSDDEMARLDPVAIPVNVREVVQVALPTQPPRRALPAGTITQEPKTGNENAP